MKAAEITDERENEREGERETQPGHKRKRKRNMTEMTCMKQLVDRKFIKYKNLKRIDKVYIVCDYGRVCVCAQERKKKIYGSKMDMTMGE